MDFVKGDNEVLNLINQVISIINQNNISDGQIMERTGNKYSKPTISNFRHLKSENPNLETFVDMCNACGIKIRLETEASKTAKVSDNIEEYRVKYADIVAENDKLSEGNRKLNIQVDNLSQTVRTLAQTNSRLSESLVTAHNRFDTLAAKIKLYD